MPLLIARFSMSLPALLLGLTLISHPAHAESDLLKDLKQESQGKDSQTSKHNPQEIKEQHRTGSLELADSQDDLSADVQDLIQDQTNPQVIDLLNKAELLMLNATSQLDAADTDGQTIAIETEVIENILKAAEKKGNKPGGNSPSSLMRMLQQMSGKNLGKGQRKPNANDKQAGEGGTGASDAANDHFSGSASNTAEKRTVPRNANPPSSPLPRHEQNAIDAYNKTSAR